MKDEIKEIINKIKKNSNHKEDINHYNRLNLKECNLLLDYITNLQTIEKEYSFLLSENAELENRIKELETINEEHRELNGNLRTANSTLCEVEDFMYNQAKEYKTRIDRAIEYIKEDMYVEPKELYGLVDGEHLLNILESKGE